MFTLIYGIHKQQLRVIGFTVGELLEAIKNDPGMNKNNCTEFAAFDTHANPTTRLKDDYVIRDGDTVEVVRVLGKVGRPRAKFIEILYGEESAT